MSEHVSLRDPYGQGAYLAYIVRANNRYKSSRRKKVNQDLRRSAAYTLENKFNCTYPMADFLDGYETADSLLKRWFWLTFTSELLLVDDCSSLPSLTTYPFTIHHSPFYLLNPHYSPPPCILLTSLPLPSLHLTFLPLPSPLHCSTPLHPFLQASGCHYRNATWHRLFPQRFQSWPHPCPAPWSRSWFEAEDQDHNCLSHGPLGCWRQSGCGAHSGTTRSTQHLPKGSSIQVI